MSRRRNSNWLAPIGVLAVTGNLLFAACQVGQSVKDFEPAHGPQGVTAELDLAGGELDGELLAVADSGLYVLAAPADPCQPPERAVLFLRWHEVAGVRLNQMGLQARGQRPPSEADLEKMSLVSRFPQGLSPDLLAGLLAAYGLEEVCRPGRGSPAETGDG